MTSTALVASDLYTLEVDSWENQLENIADNIESTWNNNISSEPKTEMTVNSPPYAFEDGVINAPSPSQSPAEIRDGFQAIISHGSTFFSTYDSVIVLDSVDIDVNGIAYLGEPKGEDYENNPHNGQAAGTEYGLGIVFDSPSPGRTAFHELLHTFGAQHSDAKEWWNLIGEDDSTVMGTGVDGCDGEFTSHHDVWNISSCTENAVNDYINDWM